MPRSQGKTESTVLEHELKSLFEISMLIQNSPATEDSLEEILRSMGRIVDFRSASLYILSKDTGKLDEICSLGRSVDLINFVNFDMGTGISAWVAQKKRPIILNNLRKTQGGSHTKSFLSVPMIFAGEVRGVINLAHDETEAFDQRDSEIMGILASLISLIVERIEHTRLESRNTLEIERLENNLDNLKSKLGEIDTLRPSHDAPSVLIEKIFNPLSIIAGNAQFLLMTMKNPGNSVLKRLKAIDSEASNLMSLAGRYQTSEGPGPMDIASTFSRGGN